MHSKIKSVKCTAEIAGSDVATVFAVKIAVILDVIFLLHVILLQFLLQRLLATLLPKVSAVNLSDFLQNN